MNRALNLQLRCENKRNAYDVILQYVWYAGSGCDVAVVGKQRGDVIR